ncbi:phosphatidylglycerophosphatase A-like protein [Desulfocapsa sulfexigens DSM 10523]|uniref:Phosphatidylglycerophosphatase A-like protein n=1 Tax=Desulfocapsa sulfexigens (strain DSM 10523 / SB164P1) TaxID=1167006 RepID=M1PCD3_DESSD|nr:phosphatidylglycerophosphatase A [Desulfocapsa sulfexigens]AGF77400.1 phosphatidylglycerophosphatase A-like protein [Desulfocapsa sulfexigens DSM 10523]
MDKIIMFLATGFYSGNLPKIPGTWGSLAALVPWFFVRNLSIPTYLATVGVIFVIGCILAGSAEKILDQADAGPIVIDEFVGMFITLIAAPNHPVAWILGFLLFRFFDILKPFPCSWFDQNIHGGFGIMMDDVIAGIYALISLQLLWMLGSKIS